MTDLATIDAAPPQGTAADQHLLFNALNAISALILTRDRAVAEEALTDFGRVLRATLRDSDRRLLPEELDDAAAYLRIAELRFPGRLTHHIDASLAAGEVKLQPFLALVEQLVDAPQREAIDVGLISRENGGAPVLALTLSIANAPEVAEAFGQVVAAIARSIPAGPARYRCTVAPGRLMGVIRLRSGA